MQRRYLLPMAIAALIATTWLASPQGDSDPSMPIPILAWVLAAYPLLLAIGSVYVVCSLWPSSEKLTAETEQIRIFTCSVPVGRETHILLIVLAMGLVGGCAYELWILRERSPRRHE